MTVSALFACLAPAQTCTPPPWGLAHWWRGEGNAFDTVSVQDGTLIGGVQFTNGEVGTAFLFSGSGDDYIGLPLNLFPMPATGEGHSPFSFEFWFQTTASGVILGQQDLPPFNSDLGGSVPAIYIGTNGLLYVEMFWSEAPQLLSSAPVNDGAFHHVVVTYDGTTEILYLDGLAIGSTPFVQEGYSSAYYYELGTGYTGGWDETTGDWFPFQGVLDEPSLYTRALTANEVATLFHAGAAGKCAPPNGLVLRHRYSFDGPPSTVLVRDSVRNADGNVVFGSNDAPYTNGVSDGSGFSGSGTLDLKGGSGCVILPPRLISVLSNFTVEAWVTWNGPSTSVWQRVFDFGISDHGTNAGSIGTNYVIFTPGLGGSQLFGFEETTVNPFGTNTDPQALTLTGPNTFPIGEEVYVAVTYDPLGGASRLFLNGALVASASGPLNPTGRFTDYSD
ncbi:MAG TPA: LamG domain-containing protein, partial [Verrucomicrobiae bacterium]|nr:LamG domain-containing protein [Verrucomicrobiae bacterium]